MPANIAKTLGMGMAGVGDAITIQLLGRFVIAVANRPISNDSPWTDETHRDLLESGAQSLKKGFHKLGSDFCSQHRRHCITDLRELARGRPDEDVAIRKSLKTGALPYAKGARNFRMQMRPAAAVRASGDDCL